MNKLGDTIERLLVSPGRAQYNSTNTGGINNGLGSSVNNLRVCFNCSAMVLLWVTVQSFIRTGRPKLDLSTAPNVAIGPPSVNSSWATQIWTIREMPIPQEMQGAVPWADESRQLTRQIKAT